MRVCAITNVYNEFFNLPIWIRYYGGQLGPENCIIVDHGSESLPPESAACSVIHTPRSTFDDNVRARTIAHLVGAMLEHYDVVLYSDCDEFLVPDPGKYDGLLDYLSRSDKRAWTAIGFDLEQNLHIEEALDPTRPILDQRSTVVFNSWLCKTLITRDPLRWDGGFHASNAEPSFDDLYLIHIRGSDLSESLKRQARTRRVEVIHPDMGSHHRWPDLTVVANALGFAQGDHRPDLEALPDLLQRSLAGVRHEPNGLYYFAEEVRPPFSMTLPERFRGAF